MVEEWFYSSFIMWRIYARNYEVRRCAWVFTEHSIWHKSYQNEVWVQENCFLPSTYFFCIEKKKKRLWCFVCHDEDVGIALISSVLEDFVYKWQVVRMYKKLRNFGVGERGRWAWGWPVFIYHCRDKNENHDNSCNYEAEQVIQVNIAHFSAYKQKHQLTLRYNNHNKLT